MLGTVQFRMFCFSLLYKNLKNKMEKTIIWPVGFYAYETSPHPEGRSYVEGIREQIDENIWNLEIVIRHWRSDIKKSF
jgi:hypothetical protein